MKKGVLLERLTVVVRGPTRQRRQLAALLAWLLFASVPGVAQALTVTDTWTVPFNAPSQSIWAPGTPVGESASEGVTQVGGIADGSFIKVAVGGDLGTVSGNVQGSLSVTHPYVLDAPGDARLDFLYTGDPDESKIKTTMGLGATITMGLRVALPFPFPPISVDDTLLDLSVDLKTDNDFTYSTGAPMDSSVGKLELIELGADIIVAGVNVGLNLQQSVFFEADDIIGMVTATHLDSGAQVSSGFVANSDVSVGRDLYLGAPGYWYVTLHGLELFGNEFSHRLGGSVAFSADVAVLGQVLGLAFGIDVYSRSPFELDFDSVPKLGGGFLINVLPEPGTGLLAGLGLIGIAVSSRNKRLQPQ